MLNIGYVIAQKYFKQNIYHSTLSISLACTEIFREKIMTQKHALTQQNKKHNTSANSNNTSNSNTDSSINLQAANSVCIDQDKRLQMIALSAYFRAEKNGFFRNSELENWLVAEQEVDRHLCSFSS
jgi:hypothetical protein